MSQKSNQIGQENPTFDDTFNTTRDENEDNPTNQSSPISHKLAPSFSRHNNISRASSRIPEEQKTCHLILTEQNEIDFKDFTEEIRGLKDIQNYLAEDHVRLNETADSLEKILDNLLGSKIYDGGSFFSRNKRRNSIVSGTDGMKQKSVIGHTLLKRAIQGIDQDNHGIHFKQSWICTMIDSTQVSSPKIYISKLSQSIYISERAQTVKYVIVIVSNPEERETKTALEISRSIATLFNFINLHDLQEASEKGANGFLEFIKLQARELRISEYIKLAAQTEESGGSAEDQEIIRSHKPSITSVDADEKGVNNYQMKKKYEERDALGSDVTYLQVGKGLWYDLTNRAPLYMSDWKDGLNNGRSIGKTLSSACFIYFACLLPSLAFGNLNAKNTDDWLNVRKVLISQTIGGLIFSLFAAQPLVILLTTAPIAIYISIIKSLADPLNTSVEVLYTLVGLWNVGFLLLASVFNLSKLMKYSTKSIEEIFGLFIACAFSKDAIKSIIKAFQNYYQPYDDFVNNDTVIGTLNQINDTFGRDKAILWLLLALGTVWLSLWLFNFTYSPLLSGTIRELLHDYSLPIAVIIFSLIGGLGFEDIQFKKFADPKLKIGIAEGLSQASAGVILTSAGLGFCLSLLFFMDQNISAALTDSQMVKCKNKKPGGYHWDLMIVAFINLILTLMGCPWVHGALPHSPLHARALADIEKRIEGRHINEEIVYVRETRTSHFFSHILIGVSIFLIKSVLIYIPTPVLDGLFLHLAITSLYGNSFFERILLFITEQRAYPPSHFVRRVPQRVIHKFTLWVRGRITIDYYH